MLAMGAYLVITHGINLGLLMAGSLLLGRALSPIDQMINNWRGFVAARVQYDRLNVTLEKLNGGPPRMALPDPESHIQVGNLVVAAPGAKLPVIRNISFVAAVGSIVGIVGPSAAGKWTLARAWLGIWTPQHGTVRLDGAAISAWGKQNLARIWVTCLRTSSCSKAPSATTSRVSAKSIQKKSCWQPVPQAYTK